MILGFLKLLAMLWPFIKEWFIGNKELHRQARKNKAATWLLMCLFVMFLLFLFAMQAAFDSRTQAVTTKHSIDLLQLKFEETERTRDSLSTDISDLKSKVVDLTSKIESFTKQNQELTLKNQRLELELRVAQGRVAELEGRQSTPTARRQRNEAVEALDRLRTQEGLK